MIDLNRIRSLKPLQEMKKDLNEFITFDPKVMVEVYEEQYQWGPEDYEADLEQAKDFLAQTEHRLKSLSNHLNKKPKVKTSKTTGSQQVDEESDSTIPS